MKISQTSGFSTFLSAWRPPPPWINIILTVSTVPMTMCITLPSLAVIGHTISGIWRSCDFSKWRWPPSCYGRPM